MRFEILSVGWLAFVAMGLFHVALYKTKLGHAADEQGSRDIALTVWVGALLAFALGLTSWLYMWDALWVRRDIALATNPIYMVSRGLITLGIAAIWVPCWKLCNRARHYWWWVGGLYGFNSAAWMWWATNL